MTAASVPRGIERIGSLRSPDIFTPAMMPVTAGKKTAKTAQNPTNSTVSKLAASDGSGTTSWPKNRAIKEAAIAAIMKYCALMATSAEVSASAVTKTVVINATGTSGTVGYTRRILSAKPMVYSATDSAWAKYSGMPTAPPVSMPSERLIM